MVQLTACDATFGRIETDESTLMDIHSLLTIDKPVPPGRRWGGQVKLMNLKLGRVALGAAELIARFCQERNIEFQYQPHDSTFGTPQEASAWIHTQSFPFRPYQRTAILTGLVKPRGLLLVPTGGGKTAILLTLIHAVLQQSSLARILWLVPTTSLLRQMASAATEEFSVPFTHDKHAAAPVLLTTWQNVQRESPKYFQDFTHVFVDECHHYTGPALQRMLQHCVGATIRWGVTATLPTEPWQQLVLRGAFGDTYTVTTSAELIANKTLNQVEIQPLLFQYRDRPPKIPTLTIPATATPKEVATLKQQHMGVAYRTEMEWLLQHSGRLWVMGKLLQSLKDRRILVLFKRLDHGARLYQHIHTVCPGRPVHYVDGHTETDVRESVRQAMRAGDDTIIIASIPTFATGIDIPELGTIVLAESLKSEIRLLQSIGRSLRRTEAKKGSVIYDIIDDMRERPTPQRWHDYAFRHGQARQRIYRRVQFPIRPFIPVQIPESS